MRRGSRQRASELGAGAAGRDLLIAGLHRKPIPDLIIASVARHHEAVLVHHDRDFDDIATVIPDLRTRWITPPPSARPR